MIDPLRLIFEVRCPVEHAFEVWTARISRWWPADHTVSGKAGVDVVLEGRRGGRIFERTPGGAEFEWGEVMVWEPPRRLGYLWHLRRDQGDSTTRVEIEHRGWERLGAQGSDWRDANRAGWASLLPHYTAACGNGDLIVEQ
jgi:uncharacterized protein YndB with AHSA1/START domain